MRRQSESPGNTGDLAESIGQMRSNAFFFFFTLGFCPQELQVPAIGPVLYGPGYMIDTKQAAGNEDPRSLSFPCALSSRVGNWSITLFFWTVNIQEP